MVPATFLNCPSQLLLFKYFDWLIQTGFSLFDLATGVNGLLFVFLFFGCSFFVNSSCKGE